MRKLGRSAGSPVQVISVDGRIVRAAKAVIPLQDWAVRYGWGAFETIRLTKGCPLFLTRHLDRLRRTAAALLLGSEQHPNWWRKEVFRTITQSGLSEGVINLYWTRGGPPEFEGHRIVVLRSIDPRRRHSGTVWIAPWHIEPGTPGVGAKTMAYLPYTFATLTAQAAGSDDAILLNPEGRIADGAAASVFVVKNQQLVTPSFEEGALPGITRDVILERAKALYIPFREIPLTMRSLRQADGVFLTSALRGITTVTRIGDRGVTMTVGAKKLVGRLRGAYRRALEAEVNSLRD